MKRKYFGFESFLLLIPFSILFWYGTPGKSISVAGIIVSFVFTVLLLMLIQDGIIVGEQQIKIYGLSSWLDNRRKHRKNSILLADIKTIFLERWMTGRSPQTDIIMYGHDDIAIAEWRIRLSRYGGRRLARTLQKKQIEVTYKDYAQW